MQYSTKTERGIHLMEHQEYAPKKRHLTDADRANIELLLKQKKSQSEIARILGRDRSVISREIKRNSVTQTDSQLRVHERYFADAATRQYDERRASTGCKIKLPKAMEMVEYVEKQIKSEQKWSPDAAIGRAKLEHPDWVSVSTKTYYNYVDQGLVNIKPIDLLLKVRLRPKTKRNRKRKKVLGKSITERPQEANDRQEIGHWEMDTVVGKREKSSVLLTLTERVTGVEIICKVPGKFPGDIEPALLKIKTRFGEEATRIFKTCTVDNGSEFSDSAGMESALGVSIFYAHPYSSFERGTNENHNGIIRRFIPKGKSIDDLSDTYIERIESFMNGLPRKRFGYQTPIEYMAEQLKTG
jgi:IS30 family transposase